MSKNPHINSEEFRGLIPHVEKKARTYMIDDVSDARLEFISKKFNVSRSHVIRILLKGFIDNNFKDEFKY